MLVDTDLSIKAAGGFFIQPLPNASEDTIDRLEGSLTNIQSVTDLVAGNLDAKGIISRIFDGFDINFLSTTDLNFRCQCSRQRIEEVLTSLSKDDLQSLIDDGKAEVACQFCGQKYQFNKSELEQIMNNG